MKHLKYLILALGLSGCEPLMAQGGLFSLVKKVGTMIDSMSVKGVDRRYIDAPEKPWQLIVRSSVSQTIVSMKNDGVAAGEEGSVGAGYAYNWVPASGLLVNVMFMPMLTLFNKLKAYGYATNIEEMMEDPVFWDDTISYEEWDKWYYENVRISPAGDTTFNSGISIGFDTRASLTYNIGRYFFNAYGQFNNIRYHHNSTHGYLNDWFVNASIGIRL